MLNLNNSILFIAERISLARNERFSHKSKVNNLNAFENFSKKNLLKIIEVYAKNWLAHDGCWFLAAEEKYGLETAMELDGKAWHRFAVSEARRIMKAFEIPENGGLKVLEQAFKYRLYAAINRQVIEWPLENKMVFKMVECRVQKTRRQKNLPDYPCKSVGIIEFSQFAATIDPQIRTRCIACPPDQARDFFCAWEFTLE